MKSSKLLRRDTYKNTLCELVKRSERAREVKYRYEVMRYLLLQEWGNTLRDIKPLEDILKDIIYIDRIIRLGTQGFDEENKKKMSQEKVLELNYEMVANEVLEFNK